MSKSPDAFRTISEVADWLGVQTHVLRFWESRFSQVKPVKRAGGRRYYRPSDMALLGGIKKLLHDDGVTIRGVQKILRERGVKYVASLSAPLDVEQEAPPAPVQVDPIPEEPFVVQKQVGFGVAEEYEEEIEDPRDDLFVAAGADGEGLADALTMEPQGSVSPEDTDSLAPVAEDRPATEPGVELGDKTDEVAEESAAPAVAQPAHVEPGLQAEPQDEHPSHETTPAPAQQASELPPVQEPPAVEPLQQDAPQPDMAQSDGLASPTEPPLQDVPQSEPVAQDAAAQADVPPQDTESVEPPMHSRPEQAEPAPQTAVPDADGFRLSDPFLTPDFLRPPPPKPDPQLSDEERMIQLYHRLEALRDRMKAEMLHGG